MLGRYFEVYRRNMASPDILDQIKAQTGWFARDRILVSVLLATSNMISWPIRDTIRTKSLEYIDAGK